MKLVIVAGARPNFMKIAPVLRALEERKKAKPDEDLTWLLVHTGQHYDYKMSKVFFDDLGIPEPDYFLNVGSGSHAKQTARIMEEFETVCEKEMPDVVAVVGDVNSTLACSITAKKLHIKVAHIEAGLRSRDLDMPEEINRMVTDSISDYLFVTETSGEENLLQEGHAPSSVFFVGNIMIDTLFHSLEKVKQNKPERPYEKPFGVVTLHRPSNVDDVDKLRGILEALVEVSRDQRLFFPIHPRTKKQLDEFGLWDLLNEADIETAEPLAYMDFLSLWRHADLLLTDSGGLQEETTALGIPCFTIRENTERPITIDQGTNTMVGTTKQGILDAYKKFASGDVKKGRVPDLWDGQTAKRIVDILVENGK